MSRASGDVKAKRVCRERQFYRRIDEVVSTVLATAALCCLHSKFKETFLRERSGGNEKQRARSVYCSPVGNEELSDGELSNSSGDTEMNMSIRITGNVDQAGGNTSGIDDECRGNEKKLEMESYASQETLSDCLEPLGNNLNALHFYAIEISPGVNFQFTQPTTICYGISEYVFQGFCLVSPVPLSDVPCCKLVRFNTSYTITLKQMPRKAMEMFCLADLDVLRDFIFHDMLDLSSWEELKRTGNDQLYILPCFNKEHCLEEVSTDQTGSLLPLGNVIEYILESGQHNIFHSSDCDIRDELLFWPCKTFPALRVDGIENEDDGLHVIHWSKRKFSSASHQRSDRDMQIHKRYRRKQRIGVPLTSKESQHMASLKSAANHRRKQRIRDERLVCSVRGALRTGLKCDIAQHALIIPALCQHIRHFLSLPLLESKLQYSFVDRALLQVSVTHPSFSLHYGSIDTDLAQVAQSNCGPRHVQYGPCRMTQLHKKKRGHCKLSELVTSLEDVDITDIDSHNQRLEFLGDTVIGYIAILHLFHLFPDLSEGSLSLYKTAIEENRNLTVLAKVVGLEHYIRAYVDQEGIALCLASCFEAVIGAMYLDGGLLPCQRLIASTLFHDNLTLEEVWMNYPPHRLQQQEPGGDRHLIEQSQFLQELTQLENSINVQFNHIRLLARAFTHSSVGFNYLTLGSYERLELLGDAVFQLTVSHHLYCRFPGHHEGSLTAFRTSLVNRSVQSSLAVELGLDKYIKSGQRVLSKGSKLLSDVLEAFVAALLLDQGIERVVVLLDACLLQRAMKFIHDIEWLDPKTRLNQLCTLKSTKQATPEYMLVKMAGSDSKSHFTVSVNFNNEQLGTGDGSSIKEAEINAARNVLKTRMWSS